MYGSLCFSCIIHFALFAYLSISRQKVIHNKPLKQIEVTYQTIKSKKNSSPKQFRQKLKIFKKKETLDNSPRITKKHSHFPFRGKDVKDITKLSNQLSSKEKLTSRIQKLDRGQKITVPLLKAEKISNPKYLSYNQTIRYKIKQRAYLYIDHPDFKAGEVYLTFILTSDGDLKRIKIIEEKTTANSYLRSVGLRSIQESSPFASFPKDLNYPELTFNVVISFEVND